MRYEGPPRLIVIITRSPGLCLQVLLSRCTQADLVRSALQVKPVVTPPGSMCVTV